MAAPSPVSGAVQLTARLVYEPACASACGASGAGAALASVVPLPASDQAPVPSSLVARTCTW